MPAKPRVVGASGGDVEEQANGAVLIHLGSRRAASGTPAPARAGRGARRTGRARTAGPARTPAAAAAAPCRGRRRSPRRSPAGGGLAGRSSRILASGDGGPGGVPPP